MQRGGALGLFEDVRDGCDVVEAANGVAGEIEHGHGGEEAHALAVALQQV